MPLVHRLYAERSSACHPRPESDKSADDRSPPEITLANLNLPDFGLRETYLSTGRIYGEARGSNRAQRTSMLCTFDLHFDLRARSYALNDRPEFIAGQCRNRCEETDPKKPPGRRRHQPVAVSLSLRCLGLHLLAVGLRIPPGFHQLIDRLSELRLIVLVAAVERVHASFVE